MNTKKCSRCKTEKPHEDFNRSKRGINSRCRQCDREYAKEYRLKYPDKVKESKRQSKYNMEKTYNEMLDHQGYKCKVCSTHVDNASKGALHVDHCHSTGKVRGLLCSNCNTALGLLKDDSHIIANLLTYLKESHGNSSTL